MNRAKELIEKYRAGKCTPEELEILYRWFDDQDFSTHSLSEVELQAAKEESRKILFDKKYPKLGYNKIWVKLAASILVFGFMYVVFQKRNQILGDKIEYCAPQSESVLILEDGEQLRLSVLDSLNELKLSDGYILSRDKNGFLCYALDSNEISAGGNKIQTLVTAVGEQESVLLPDGTKIWLNSNSKLSFSLQTSNLTNREFRLEGEGYFDVAKQIHPKTNKPIGFWVYSQNQIVKVLGTSFNISAYKEDAEILTTLVSGSVELDLNTANSATKKSILLKPGQQAQVQDDGFAVANVDVSDYVLWKSGVLYLNDQSIFSMMKSISRWYPIEVAYEGNFADVTFGGTFSKHKKLEDILNVLELTGHVKFEIDENARKERRILVKRN